MVSLSKRDKAACHIFVPNYNSSHSGLRQASPGVPHSHLFPAFSAFKCDQIKRWLSLTAVRKSRLGQRDRVPPESWHWDGWEEACESESVCPSVYVGVGEREWVRETKRKRERKETCLQPNSKGLLHLSDSHRSQRQEANDGDLLSKDLSSVQNL